MNTNGMTQSLTLIFSVPSLNFFMHAFLDHPLEYSCPGWLVVVGDFKNMSSVDVIINASAHDMIPLDIVLEHWHLA